MIDMKLTKLQKERIKMRLYEHIKLEDITWGAFFGILEKSLPVQWKNKNLTNRE